MRELAETLVAVRLWFAVLLGYWWETEMQRLLTSVVPLSLQEVIIEIWSCLDAAEKHLEKLNRHLL